MECFQTNFELAHTRDGKDHFKCPAMGCDKAIRSVKPFELELLDPMMPAPASRQGQRRGRTGSVFKQKPSYGEDLNMVEPHSDHVNGFLVRADSYEDEKLSGSTN